MNPLALSFVNAEVLLPEGFVRQPLSMADGFIDEASKGRQIDLTGYQILPGIVDLHGDGFERHLAPRRGAVKDLQTGFYALHSELASNGITTAVLAQFYSWEGGMRGPDFAHEFLAHLEQFGPKVPSTLLPQLRFETHMLDHYTEFAALCARYAVPYVVFNDHLPHHALAKGKRPARLTGQALKSGRSPEEHLELLKVLHEKSDQVAAALPDLIAALGAGVLLGSHDDARAQDRFDDRQAAAIQNGSLPGVDLDDGVVDAETGKGGHDKPNSLEAHAVLVGNPRAKPRLFDVVGMRVDGLTALGDVDTAELDAGVRGCRVNLDPDKTAGVQPYAIEGDDIA